MRVDAGPNREIQAMTRRRQVADGGRDAHAFAPIARPRADAGRLGIVVVPDLREAGCACGVEEGAIQRLPRFRARALDPDRSADAVKIAARVAIVFELAMERQDLLEAPFAIAPRGPFVEVARRATQRDMAVDGGAATGDLAARIGDFAIRRRIRGQMPVMRSGGNPGLQQIVRSVLDRGVVGAGLEQQNVAIRIFAQARGQDRTRRTGANDNIVVLHRSTPPDSKLRPVPAEARSGAVAGYRDQKKDRAYSVRALRFSMEDHRFGRWAFS